VNPLVFEWLSLLVRWMHIFTGILWVGATWYFGWLDYRLREAAERGKESGVAGAAWLAVGGALYRVERTGQAVPAGEGLHWFKWEALITWVNGLLLLMLVYWAGGALIDPDVSRLTEPEAMLFGLGVLVAGWVLYDLLFRGPLERNGYASAAAGYMLALAAAWALLHTLAPRAAWLHLGALFGTIMTLNVWMRILPAQRKALAAVAKGEVPDEALGVRVQARAAHNAFLVIPLLFTMISNHFPTATFGHDHAFAILAAMVAGGWLLAWRIRGQA
jgi:uncharacterized membrane protein